VHGLMILAVSLSPTGDWTQAAAIMTFAIPVGLFVIVAIVLYFLYTRPHAVPGHRELAPAGASGRHVASGGGRHAAPEPPAGTQPPSAGPPQAGGYPPSGGSPGGGGGTPGAGGYGNYGGTEGR
jgi:hypothetical protein